MDRRCSPFRRKFWKSLTRFAFGDWKRSQGRTLTSPLQLRVEDLEERRLLSVSTLSIPKSLGGQVGQTITVPIELEVTQPGGLVLNGADVAITYDSTKFSASNARPAPTLASGFSTATQAGVPGAVKFTASSGTGVQLPQNFHDALFLVDFTILSGAGTTSSIDLEHQLNELITGVYEDITEITLIPAPTNNSDDAVDGLITIQAANTAPTAEAGGPYNVNEGSTVSLSATGTIDAQQSTASLTYLWDLDGDNTFGETGGAAGRGNETGIGPTFNAAGVSGPSTVTAKLLVVDDGGLSSADTATISISNVAPTANAGGPYTVAEGATVALSGSGSDPVDAITYTWDLDRDGTYGETGATATHGNETGPTPIYNAAGISGPQNATIRLKVTDANGTATTSTTVITITNVAPSGGTAGPFTVAEGATVAVSGTGVDVTDSISLAWDLDNDGTFGETGAAALRGNEVAPTTPFTNAAPGGVTSAILLLDDIQYTFAWDSAQGAYSMNPGNQWVVQQSGKWVYVDAILDEYPIGLPTTSHPFYKGAAFWDAAWPAKGWDLEFGAGFVAGRPTETSAVVFNAAGLSGPTTATVKLRVVDADGASTTSTTSVQVTNVAPTANAGGPYTVAEGATVALSGSGTDPVDALTYTWDLDRDGTYGETGATATHGNETGPSPVYNAAGISGPQNATIPLKVTDANGSATTSTTIIAITNAAPSGGTAGPFTVAEGGTVGISGTGVDVTDGITMVWDLDGDGTFGETGVAATRGSEVTPTNPFIHAAPDGVTVGIFQKDDIQYTFTWDSTDGVYNEEPGNTWIEQVDGMWVYNGNPGVPTPMRLPTTRHPFFTGAAFWDAAWAVKGWDLEFGTNFVPGRPTETSSVVFNAAGLSGPATATVTFRVIDVDGGSTTSTTTIQVTNVAPTANSGGPYTVAEGGAVGLAGTGTDPVDTITFAWDLDGDGQFGETGPVTSDFRVNTVTTGTKEYQRMAGNANGDYVVVWRNGQVYARLFDSSGTPKGPQIKVSTEPFFSEYRPSVAINDSGTFVVSYAQPGATASHFTIAAQRFNAAGTRVGNEILVSEIEGYFQLDNDVAIDAAGNFVVTWAGSDRPEDSTSSVYARRVAADGTPQGSEFLVNTNTADVQSSPSVAMDAGGNFIISWTDDVPVNGGIYGQRFDSSGTRLGANFKVQSMTIDYRRLSSVAMNASGDFVIAWEQWNPDGAIDNDIYVRRYNSSGTPLGTEFIANSYTTNGQTDPDVAMNANGEFVVGWTDLMRDGSGKGLFARKFNANGTPQGSDFALNSITAGVQDEVTVSIDGQGRVSAAWKGPDGATTGIYTTSTNVPARGIETGSNPTFNASAISGPATATVTLRVTDANGASTTSTTTVVVTNVAPTANAGGPYTIAEGVATAALSGTGSDPFGPLTFAWDLDGDGSFGETGGAALRGNETGATPVYNASGLNGPLTSSVTLRVTDPTGASTQATSTVSLTNPALRVTSLTPTSTGFVAQFNQPLDPSTLNLYDQGGILGAADATLIGAATGAVRGSLLIGSDLRSITFVKSGGVLAPDTYTVNLESNSQAFRSTSGALLDGNSDLISGDNYRGNFTIAAPAGNAVTLSVPDFTRGYGQSVNLPFNQSVGIPITLSSGKNISGVDFRLQYDPTLLSISNVTVGSGLGASLQFNSSTPGLLVITVNSASELSATVNPITLVNLIATVPTSAPYGAKQLLNLTNIHAFDASVLLTEVPSIDNDGVHVAAYFGDANGSQTYNSPDASLAQRMIVGSVTGFLSYPLADPNLIVDISGNAMIQSNDVTLIQQTIVGTAVNEIPPHPGLSFEAPSGADPLVFIPQNLSAAVGESIVVPVELLVTEPSGIALAGVDLAISYDASKLALSDAEVGQLLVGFGLNANTSTPGVVRLSLAGNVPLALPFDAFGTLATLHFTVLAGAGSLTSINLLAESNPLHTALYDEQGAALTLVPAPTDEDTDSVDGQIELLSDRD